MDKMKNCEIYDTLEYKSWASRFGLISEEKYLFKKILFTKKRHIKALDIGTGNGRLLFALAQKGFTDLHGIDLSENLLSQAKLRSSKKLSFYKMSATSLQFEDNTFDVCIALQQVISLISTKEDRIKAFKECYRVLKPNGLLICSVLHYEGRWFNPLFAFLTVPLKVFKRDFEFLESGYLPWLKLGGRLNLKYLFERQPYVYWFRTDEILKMIENVNFELIEITTTEMLKKGFNTFKKGGMLYFVAQKRV